MHKNRKSLSANFTSHQLHMCVLAVVLYFVLLFITVSLSYTSLKLVSWNPSFNNNGYLADGAKCLQIL